jgi:hypothetical protein
MHTCLSRVSGRTAWLASPVGHCCSSTRGSRNVKKCACMYDQPVYTYICQIDMQFSAVQHRSLQSAVCSVADALTHSHLSVSLLLLLYAGAYSASKHALHSISDILRVELAPLGIDVMLVVPGEMPSHCGSRSFVLRCTLCVIVSGVHALALITTSWPKRFGLSRYTAMRSSGFQDLFGTVLPQLSSLCAPQSCAGVHGINWAFLTAAAAAACCCCLLRRVHQDLHGVQPQQQPHVQALQLRLQRLQTQR